MSTQKSNNFLRFLRQNLVLIIIIACVLATTGIILGVSLGKSPVTPVGPSVNDTYLGEFNDYLVPPKSEEQKPTFMSPVAEYTLGMDYSRDSEYVLVFKKTLNEWSVHNGVDFLAEEGAAVVAICDGTVTSVRNEYGMGNIVEITHRRTGKLLLLPRRRYRSVGGRQSKEGRQNRKRFHVCGL